MNDRPWLAERPVRPEQARRLVEAQFPELAPATVELLGAGWDNTAVLINGTAVFRFPRRRLAVPWLEREARLLPSIQARLPAPIPSPAWIGSPTRDFPWMFSGYPLLPGCSLEHSSLSRGDLAQDLGLFLKALHAVDPDEAVRHGAAPDELGRMDVDRQQRAQQRLQLLSTRGLLEPHPAYDAILEERQAIEPAGQVLVHGDLYARHLLVGERGRLSGVIDWGDVHLGCAATDLAVGLAAFDGPARQRFFESYGAVDRETLVLSRFRALTHALAVAVYALDVGDRSLTEEMLRGLQRLLP